MYLVGAFVLLSHTPDQLVSLSPVLMEVKSEFFLFTAAHRPVRAQDRGWIKELMQSSGFLT